MPAFQPVATEISLDLFTKLEDIAQARHCSSACILKEVVEDYVLAREYLEKKICDSLEASALGQTKSHADVKNMIRGMSFH